MTRVPEDVDINSLDWSKGGGLLPVVVQEDNTGLVLMLAYTNAEALQHTLRTGFVHFFSRSRSCLWRKGETSGNHLRVRRVYTDCDRDALLMFAQPDGPTCHTGRPSCFDSRGPWPAEWARLNATVAARADIDTSESYTATLLQGGAAAAGRKVGEEAVETVVAALTESDDRLVEEAADLVYHLCVLLRSRGLGMDRVADVLSRRASGALAEDGDVGPPEQP